MSALKGQHKRVEYRACKTRNQTLETLETQVSMIENTIGKACFDYGLQQITDFNYKFLRFRLFITDVVKSTTNNYDCCHNDDINFGIINLWPTRNTSFANCRTSQL